MGWYGNRNKKAVAVSESYELYIPMVLCGKFSHNDAAFTRQQFVE